MDKKETMTPTTTLEGNAIELKSVDGKTNITIVKTPIFIIFAEYMGYISNFNKLIEDWCDGKVPEVHVQKFLEIEALCMLRQMKQDYDVETIKYYYDSYYPLILEEYEEKLNKILENE